MRKSLHGFRSAAVKLWMLTATGLSAAACDGVGWTGPLDVDQSPTGIYIGSFMSTATQPSPSRQTIGVVSEEFDANFLLTHQHYAGNVAVDGISLSGVLIEYRGRQGVFIGFDGLSAVSIEGEVTERDGLFGIYAGDDAEGRFALAYSETYEEGSSLDLLSGIYSYSESSSGGAVYMITVELDGGGRLFATDTAGCVLSGQVTAIDDRYSAYRVSISVSECGAVDGDYDGLAFYQSANESLYIGTDNGQFAFSVQLGRL
jgi:hypothetical protein